MKIWDSWPGIVEIEKHTPRSSIEKVLKYIVEGLK
jgi:hypothetical protein